MDHTVQPEVDGTSRTFWDGLKHNQFRAARCEACGTFLFPAREICRNCHSRDTTDTVIDGPGVIYSFTVNYHCWGPGYEEPYGVVLVEYPHHSRVRLLGLADVPDLSALTIGAQVWLRPLRLSSGLTIPAFTFDPQEPSTT